MKYEVTIAYEVTITAKFPSYGEQPGIEIIFARDSKEAIKKARNMMRLNGHTRQDGPISYKAKAA